MVGENQSNSLNPESSRKFLIFLIKTPRPSRMFVNRCMVFYSADITFPLKTLLNVLRQMANVQLPDHCSLWRKLILIFEAMTMLCEMHRKKVEKLLTICNLPTEFLLGKNPVFLEVVPVFRTALHLTLIILVKIWLLGMADKILQ